MTSTNRTIINKAMLVLLPICFVIASGVLRQAVGPYWLLFSADPEYQYLLNAVGILHGQMPGLVFHPGVPLHYLGAGVLGVANWFQGLTQGSSWNLIDAVLRNPESYCNLIHFVLVGLITVAITAVGWVGLNLSGSLLLALLLQTTVLQSVPLYESVRVRPEPIIFVLVQILVILLLYYLYQPKIWRTWWMPLLLGGIFAIGLLSKLNFLPLCLILFVLPTLKQKLVAIASTVILTLIGAMPIRAHFPFLLSWVMGLANKSDSSRFTWEKLQQAYTYSSFQTEYFFILTLVSTLIFLVFLFARNKSKDELFRRVYGLSGLICLICLVQIAMTLFNRPGGAYLIPAISLSGLLLFLQVKLIASRISGSWKNAVPILGLGLALAASLYSSFSIIDNYQKTTALRVDEEQKVNQIIQARNCREVLYYGSGAVEQGLRIGVAFVPIEPGRINLGQSLDAIYPNAIYYNNFRFETATHALDRNQLLTQNSCVAIRTKSFSPEERKTHFRENLEVLYTGVFESLYRVETSGKGITRESTSVDAAGRPFDEEQTT